MFVAPTGDQNCTVSWYIMFAYVDNLPTVCACARVSAFACARVRVCACARVRVYVRT